MGRTPSPSSSSRRPGPGGHDAAASAGGRVLIVEGDRELRESLCELLRLEGFEVVAVDGGLDALLQLLTAEPLPDLVIYDDDRAEMTGAEFRRLLDRNAAAAHVPLLVLTSTPVHARQDEPGTFEKPCSPEALAAAVAAAVQRRRS